MTLAEVPSFQPDPEVEPGADVRQDPVPFRMEPVVEPVEFLRLIRRRWQFVAVLVLAGLAVGWVTGSSRAVQPRARSFTATATLALNGGNASSASNRPATASSDVPSLETMAFLATTGDVPKRVAEKIAFGGPPALLAGRVTSTPDRKLNTISLKVSDGDGPRAAEIANTFATELIASLDERLANQRAETLNQLNDRQRQLKDRIAGLDAAVAAQPQDSATKAQRDASVKESADVFSRIADLNAKGPPVAGLTVLQEAAPVPVADKSVALPTSRVPRMIVAAILALFVSIGGLLLWDRFDTRVRTKEDAEAMFGLPVVAEVPRLTRRAKENPTRPVGADRLIRASLLLSPRDGRSLPAGNDLGYGQEAFGDTGAGLAGSVEGWKGVVLVTSPGPAEGKSTSVAGLAASFAEIGKSVLVLSWDFYNPAIHRYLGVEEGLGLTDVLGAPDGKVKLRDVVRSTDIGEVGLVTTGSRALDPAVLFGRGPEVLGHARDLADVVIVDTAPILFASDALELMPAVDTVVLVSRVGHTSVDSAQRASELLGRFAAPVHGVVLVGTDPSRYSKGYRDYRVAGSEDRVTPERDSRSRHRRGRKRGRRGQRTAGPLPATEGRVPEPKG